MAKKKVTKMSRLSICDELTALAKRVRVLGAAALGPDGHDPKVREGLNDLAWRCAAKLESLARAAHPEPD